MLNTDAVMLTILKLYAATPLYNTVLHVTEIPQVPLQSKLQYSFREIP